MLSQEFHDTQDFHSAESSQDSEMKKNTPKTAKKNGGPRPFPFTPFSQKDENKAKRQKKGSPSKKDEPIKSKLYISFIIFIKS